MRFIVVSWRDLANSQAGGSEVVNDRLARALIRRGHEVHLVCPRPIGGPYPYATHSSGTTYRQYLEAPFVVRKLARAKQATLIDVSNGLPYFSPLWYKGPRICLVHHVHLEQWGDRFPRPLAALGRLLESKAFPAAYQHEFIAAVSQSTAMDLEKLGIPAERIKVISWGVDQVEEDHEDATEPLFVALGRMVPHKRLELVLRAWEKVRSVTGGSLLILGDGPEKERIRSLAGPGVTIKGHVSEEEKIEILRHAWMLVHCAHHEGWGMAIMEAATCGTPALALRARGVSDSIVDGVTGVMVDSQEELSSTWISMALDSELRKALGQAARQRAAKFTWDETAKAFEEIAVEAGSAKAQGCPR